MNAPAPLTPKPLTPEQRAQERWYAMTLLNETLNAPKKMPRNRDALFLWIPVLVAGVGLTVALGIIIGEGLGL